MAVETPRAESGLTQNDITRAINEVRTLVDEFPELRFLIKEVPKEYGGNLDATNDAKAKS